MNDPSSRFLHRGDCNTFLPPAIIHVPGLKGIGTRFSRQRIYILRATDNIYRVDSPTAEVKHVTFVGKSCLRLRILRSVEVDPFCKPHKISRMFELGEIRDPRGEQINGFTSVGYARQRPQTVILLSFPDHKSPVDVVNLQHRHQP